MAEKDTTEKVLLSIDEVFADVMNVFAFHKDHRSDFRVVADYFVQKHRNHRYQPRRGKMKYIKQVCDLLAAATGDRHFVDKYNIIAQAKEGGPDDMCEIVEQFIEEGKAEGRAEGELNAMFKLVSQDLLPAQIAAEQTGLTVEEFHVKLNDYLSKAKKD